MVKKSTLGSFANTVRIAAGRVMLAGNLSVPAGARGLVLFAHGSGSSRHSPRNRYVAKVLNEASLATLLFDLLTPEEERNRANVFDIELLASRLVDVTGWLASQPDAASLPVGYFAASTGAGALDHGVACELGEGGHDGEHGRAHRPVGVQTFGEAGDFR